MYVIGTAGHVDHGKSALIQALTGIDPDRLREEKERGMTIDLGFAWLTLPSGNEVSIVDVPGHERFIKNMLAGVGGIDLALLVVAADEGIMPQTREHLAIIDLLQIERGIVVITKKDLVDEEWLSLVQAELEEVIKDTTLAGSPVVAVSSVTGDGLPEFLTTIEERLKDTSPKKDIGRPRLPIDRAFTMSGFGTVVTGTLIDGPLSIGQEVELVPNAHKGRIRGLQSHKHKIEKVLPGRRVAVNLSGVSADKLFRGEVLTTPGWLRRTIALDVKLRLIQDAPYPIKHNAPVSFHTGTFETLAKVRLLEKEELKPGESAWAQIRLQKPAAAVKGDFFIVRSPQTTLGGGAVIEPHPPRHRRFHTPTLERLEVMERGTPQEIALKTLEAMEPCNIKAVVTRSNLSQEEVQGALEALVNSGEAIILGSKGLGPSVLLYSSAGWQKLSEKARHALELYHRQHPLRQGAPKEELRSRLNLSPQIFVHVIQRWVQEDLIIEEGTSVRLPSHGRALTEDQKKAMENYLKALQNNPYSPPTDISIDPDLLNILIQEGKVTKVSPEVVFAASAYEEMVKRVVETIKSQGNITVAQVRDILNTSRKYALALMEHLDQVKITRRVGDERVLR